jgi:16S rRNA (cytosine967-C5)-methyltransferase
LSPDTRRSPRGVSPARTAACEILLRVEREAAYASELLHSASYERLSTADHALTTELVMGILRWRSVLDDEIAKATSQPLAKLDLEILLALRIALYQLRWLDRVPARAAIYESVELVKQARKKSAATFVNAVLRKLASAKVEISSAESANSPQTLARSSAHPLWLVERWTNHYGLPAASRICHHNQSIPTTAIRLRDSQAEGKLANAGIRFEPGALLASARRIHAGDVTRTEAFRKGRFVIQDEASQLVAALVGNGTNILDCCAAPGNKTQAIADNNPNANITALDLHPHRARLLQEMLKISTGNSPAGGIQVVAADARTIPFDRMFDCVLADVPCSGTGTLARNPEIKWRLKPADLAQLQARQVAILRSALHQTSPGGRVIYATCSLEKEENEEVVEQAMAENTSFRLLHCEGELMRLKEAGKLVWPDPASLTTGPYLRTLPGVHPCDGFFAAIVENILVSENFRKPPERYLSPEP